MRAWEIADNERIAALERECFEDPWNKQMLDGTVNAGNFYGLVEEDDGVVVGYIGTAFDLWDAEILLVAVAEDHRRKGIAKALLTAVIDKFKRLNKENIFLEVRESNLSAQALYYGLGFKKIATREKYYANTEDAFVLQLALKDL